ncbi:transmembrane protein 237B-like [Rhopilema esculentum]|uniref:transmembrane protein 237B-like n=1 Tax=Rhopilema esculentum TaxID=499914 RepID=UPI0031D625F2
MSGEEEPMNPYPSKERRRRRHHSASDDNKNAASSSGALVPGSSKDGINQERRKENGALGSDKDSSMRKKRVGRRQTPEPELSEESKENVTLGRSERRRQRKPQNAQRIPRSVSEEVLALEGKFQPHIESEVTQKVAQGKRSRRSRRRDPDNPDDASEEPMGIPENQVVDRQPPRPRIRNTQPKKKRKTRNAMMTSGDEENYQGDMDGEVSEVFKIDKEDIIQSDVSQSTGKIAPINATNLPSQPLDFLFIEKRDGQGFIKEHKDKIDRANMEQNVVDHDVLQLDEREISSMEFALQIHSAFRIIALICHGLLAGIGLIQCVFVYSLTDNGYVNFLENYHGLAQPFQALYYFLLAICTVSVFDRYVNIGIGWSQFFLALLSRPSRALAIVGYLFALVFSVSLAQLDDKISLYKDAKQLWTSTSQISTWRVINLVRAIGAVLGWISISLNPLDDLATKNINAIIEHEKDEIRNNIKSKSGTLASWEQQGVA